MGGKRIFNQTIIQGPSGPFFIGKNSMPLFALLYLCTRRLHVGYKYIKCIKNEPTQNLRMDSNFNVI